ncbi:hypothetical protein BegalDRAFT_0818 [Beggiatoa alba B18LD]|uniref:Uncharacterized protein n=1 Tax=Beggiatoa alba B18LD TaxID=395493 RepID=I3CDN6_9GAMM|nr:hypothetical protein [Beggiatoa alba]EIJ41729.1 hypothetical protein BegalDRAFT_0818 [Beggiatoa alba B18LD]
MNATIDWFTQGMQFRRTTQLADLPPLQPSCVQDWLAGVKAADEAETDIFLLTDCCATEEFQYCLTRQPLVDFFKQHLTAQPDLLRYLLTRLGQD